MPLKRTLSIFRHAKSAWDHPGLNDFKRPLAYRGQKAAPRMGAFLAGKNLVPDLVLCSSAVRTRDTLALLLPTWPERPNTLYDDALYHAGPQTMLNLIANIEAGIRHIMIIAHNPGIAELAEQLIDTANPGDLKQLYGKFPTAAVAVISFQSSSWRDIQRNQGTLELFMTPKRLP